MTTLTLSGKPYGQVEILPIDLTSGKAYTLTFDGSDSITLPEADLRAITEGILGSTRPESAFVGVITRNDTELVTDIGDEASVLAELAEWCLDHWNEHMPSDYFDTKARDDDDWDAAEYARQTLTHKEIVKAFHAETSYYVQVFP